MKKIQVHLAGPWYLIPSKKKKKQKLSCTIIYLIILVLNCQNPADLIKYIYKEFAVFFLKQKKNRAVTFSL